MSQEVGGALYAQQAEAGGTPGAGAGAEGATTSDDDVVDAEIVDEGPDEGSDRR